MSVLAWGKPSIYIREEGSEDEFRKLPDAVENTVTLEPTKGEKTEAKVEGGENEDAKTKANTYVLNVSIRGAKGRKKPIKDNDGRSIKNYEIYLQPEDPTCLGLYIARSSASLMDSFSAADGVIWAYAFDVLKPETGNQIKFGTVTVSEAGVPSIVEIGSDED